jgi:hypothetical protein
MICTNLPGLFGGLYYFGLILEWISIYLAIRTRRLSAERAILAARPATSVYDTARVKIVACVFPANLVRLLYKLL